MWVDKDRVLLRENETKVVITIGNYLNNLKGSGKADSELTNPCMCGTHHSVTIVTQLPTDLPDISADLDCLKI